MEKEMQQESKRAGTCQKDSATRVLLLQENVSLLHRSLPLC